MNKEKQRLHAAVAAMQGYLASYVVATTAMPDSKQLAKDCIKYADALLAELDRTAVVKEPFTTDAECGTGGKMMREPQPNDDGWRRHIPGDPMPDIKAERIEIMTRDGSLNSGNPKYFDFGISFGDDSDEIVAWRVAE